MVVFFLASTGEPPCLGQVGELLTVQELVPQPAEERFRKTVLPGAAGLDVEHLQAHLLAMTTDRRSDELRAIVATNVPRRSTREEQVGQDVERAIRRDAAIHLQGQALAGVF